MDTYIQAAISDMSDEPFSVREELATSPDTAAPMLEMLAKDADWRIRAQVAENPNTPWDVLVALGQDPDFAVRIETYVPYEVEVKFCGLTGASATIEVEARPGITKDDLLQHIRECYDYDLIDLLEVTETVDLGDDDWEVTLNFNGFIGCDETYDVYASDEDEAIDIALDESIWDFDILSFECLGRESLE